MSRLAIGREHLESVLRHAEAAYPEECCGALVGRGPGGDEGVAVEGAVPLDNERADSRHNRYLIHPETVLAAQREARRSGLDIVGYYHSHPDHPAVPSDFDREHAWPGMSYLIVSVRRGRAAGARSWRLADDRGRFDEETVEETSEPAAGAGAAATTCQETDP